MRTERDVSPEFRLIGVTHSTRAALLDNLDHRLTVGKGFALATVNLDHMVKLRRDSAFRTAYHRHTHIVADGNPIVWLHRLAGRRIELITGSDLVQPLMELAATHQVPVAFFGSSQETLDLAAERLTARYARLRVVARISPALGFEPARAAADDHIKTLAASGAQICFVALGAPKQELFVARAMERLPHCGFVSIGAGLDFVAGTQRRAPRWLRRLALEWLWRLAGDRKRLARRYWDCALILPGLALTALQMRWSGKSLLPPDPLAGTKPAEYTPEPLEK